jgi:hypothetical protein
MKPPRGIRARNPGNIRKTATEWMGEIEGFDPDFETFASAEYGIRAIAKILLTYHRKHHLKSVGAIISRWAPEADSNDTPQYIKTVSGWMGVEPDEPLDLESNPRGHLQLTALVQSIIRFEQGRKPDKTDWYDSDTIIRGVNLALEG